MCGISGIVGFNSKSGIREKLKKMNNLIKHRGPDAEGEYIVDKVAFAHRRLSILDLTEAGKQPMFYDNKNLVITYNGEIYNYLEIKEELKRKKYEFINDTDTEVILAAYKEWGEECVNKFNGMWAFAIYDKKNEKLFCSRDRFGIKPFYYRIEDNIFYFGSEIKQLLNDNDNEANLNNLINYLILGLEEYNDETFFKNIKKLPLSHNLVVDLKTNNIKIENYYDLEHKIKNKKYWKEEEAIEKYKKIFCKSISLRLRSDVKVGTCLSGGLDSSSIAIIAGEEYFRKSNRKMIAIHGKSIEKKNDESRFAEIVSRDANLDLNLIEPNVNEFKNLIEEVVYTQEEPFGSTSIFMQYLVMQKAKELGCTVMLDGQGGDETLLGYERYYAAYLNQLPFYKFYNGINKIKKNSIISIPQILKYTIGYSSYYLRKKIIIDKKVKKLKKNYINYIDYELIKNSCKMYTNISKLQAFEINKIQMPHLLKYEDRNSMRNSIETRLPFIDYNVLETALLINDNIKIKDGWTKYILRKAMDKEMSSQITWRKDKLGFASPEKTWLDSIEKDMEMSIKNSKIISSIIKFDELKIKDMDKREKWRFYNVAKWEEIYKVVL